MSKVQDIAASLSAFGQGAQNKRLMRLEFPKNDGPHAILLPNTLKAHEEVSRSYRFEVEVLSDEARIPLKAMMARMVTVSLVRAGGSLRHFNGYVTEFRFLRTDGGFAFYQMVLEPFMAFARLRQDNVSFHGRTMRQITEATLAHYRQADWHMFTHDEDPVLTVANQHNETDYNHLHRRWEARGMIYWYEHREDGHTLMLSDNSMLAGPIDVDRHDDADVIAFHAQSGSREDDGIFQWSPQRTLGSGFTTLASFNYKNPTSQFAEGQSANRQGDFFAYEIYENTGADGFLTHQDGERLAQQRMVERDKDTQTFEAASNDRTVQPGRGFKLGGHFSGKPRSLAYDPEPRGTIEKRDYLILSVDHEASNNYQAGASVPSRYENKFTCVRSAIRWRPGRNYHSTPCVNPGVQTAIVVGPAGQEIHTDGLGRVKVQFHWDRLGTRDEKSSAWIRVMTPAAGGQFGHVRLPRVGEEVVVVYPDGNMDHPLIIGGVYNATHMPPWELPQQLALAGLRSRELGGGARSNHLVLDDTAGKIQAQLKSDHQCSQLSLGHISRIEDAAGRKDVRGEGWELRTDGHGVARAAKGMLITTEARQTASGPIKDMGETSQRLAAAGEQHERLAEIAKQNGAQESADSQTDVAHDLLSQNEAIRGSGLSGGYPELAKPHLVLASTAGIVTAAGGDYHITSDKNTAITAGKSLSLAVGTNLFASIHNAFRLFVQKAGMKMVAAGGDIDIQALSASIKLLAKIEISQTANRITICAKEELVINGGGSYAKFAAGSIELGTSGTFTGHAASHSFQGPKNMSVNGATAAPTFTRLPDGKVKLFDEAFVLKDKRSGAPLANVEYRIRFEDGTFEYGVTDANGHTHVATTAESETLILEVQP